jgi:hypothetical protein
MSLTPRCYDRGSLAPTGSLERRAGALQEAVDGVATRIERVGDLARAETEHVSVSCSRSSASWVEPTIR